MDATLPFDVTYRIEPTWRTILMARQVFIDFPPSTASDVVGYLLYYAPNEEGLGFDDSFVDLGLPDPVDGIISVEISAIPEFQSLDGTYDLGVAAVDDAGNVSPTLVEALKVPLDFVAPPAPASLSVRFV